MFATRSDDDSTLHYTVAYPDTDAAGVVFHGRYLEMAERGRNRVLNLAGFSYASLAREHDTLLTVYKVEAVYRASAVLEDHLRIRTRLMACTVVRTLWLTEILRGDESLASVSAEVVALNAGTRTLRRYPEPLIDALAPCVAALTGETRSPRRAGMSHEFPRLR